MNDEQTKEEKFEKATTILNDIKSGQKVVNSKFRLFLQRLYDNVINPHGKEE